MIWVEYPDIEDVLRKIGAEPSSQWADGSPQYAVPVIVDDSTNRVVSDSIKIAEYLDDAYPSLPALFPFSSRAPIHMFNDYFMSTAIQPMGLLLLSSTPRVLNPRSEDYYRRTREAKFKVKLDSVADKREMLMAAGQEGWTKLASLLAKNGPDTSFFYGDTPSYADVIVTAFLLWMKTVLGPDSAEWATIITWDGKYWATLLKNMEKF